MKTNKEGVWNIILIVSLLLIIHGMSNSDDSDKKTAQAAQSEAAIGGIGVVGSIVAKKQAFWSVGLVKALPWLVGLFALLPNIFSSWFNTITGMFNPQPSIPSWIWIGGFVILFLIILKKK